MQTFFQNRTYSALAYILLLMGVVMLFLFRQVWSVIGGNLFLFGGLVAVGLITAAAMFILRKRGFSEHESWLAGYFIASLLSSVVILFNLHTWGWLVGLAGAILMTIIFGRVLFRNFGYVVEGE